MIVRATLYVTAAAVAVAGLVTAIGYALPQRHVASREAFVNAAPDAVFARISDPARYPEWRTDVSNVEVTSATPLRWREESGGDVITYEIVESVPPERLVVRIADRELPFGGTWTYELHPAGAGTRLVITERGEVYNPFFRFMRRFVFSPTATIETVIRQLSR